MNKLTKTSRRIKTGRHKAANKSEKNSIWLATGLVAALALMASLVLVSSTALAASTFTDNLWRFAATTTSKTIDFRKGGSKIIANANLHITTDDLLYLNAPHTTFVQNRLNVGGVISGNGSGLTSLNASNLASGTVNDARLSANVAKLNAATNAFDGKITATGNIETSGVFKGNGSELTHLNVTVDNLDSLTLNSALTVFNNDLGVGDDLNVGDRLTVNGNTYLQGKLDVDGTAEFDNDVTIGENYYDSLTVNALSTFNNDVTLNYSSLIFDYGEGGGGYDDYWEMYVGGGGSFNLYNDRSGHDTLTVSEWGDVDIYDDLYVGDDLTVNNDLTVWGDTITLGNNAGDWNCWGQNCSEIYLNGRLYSNTGVISVGRKSYNQDFRVWGDVDLQSDTITLGQNAGDWNCFGQDCSSIYLNGRLYSNTDIISVGRKSYNQDFRVWGDTDLRGDLNVKNDLAVNGDTTLGNKYGDTLGQVYHGNYDRVTINGRLFGADGRAVTVGTLFDQNDFKVWGDTYLNDDVHLGNTFADDINVNGRLFGWLGGAVTVGRSNDHNDFKVWGESEFKDDVTLDYASLIFDYGYGSDRWEMYADEYSGDLYLYNDSSGNYALTVSEWGDINTNDDLSVGDDLYVYDDLDVGDDLYVDDDLTVDDRLVVWGNTYLQGKLDVDGNAEFDGNVEIAGTLDVGNATINNLTVSGSTTWSGSVTYNGSATYNGSLTAGATTLTGALTATSATFSNTLTANAGVNFSGASSLRVPVTTSNLGDDSISCTAAGQGAITYTTNNNRLYYCNGDKWQRLGNYAEIPEET